MDPRMRRFHAGARTTDRVLHVSTYLTVVLSCFLTKSECERALLRAPRSGRHLPRIDPIFSCTALFSRVAYRCFRA